MTLGGVKSSGGFQGYSCIPCFPFGQGMGTGPLALLVLDSGHSRVIFVFDGKSAVPLVTCVQRSHLVLLDCVGDRKHHYYLGKSCCLETEEEKTLYCCESHSTERGQIWLAALIH